MRRPNSRELKVLKYMLLDTIEKPGNFPGAGKKTFGDMIDLGWIEWVDSPKTNEAGYRITAEGIKVRH